MRNRVILGQFRTHKVVLSVPTELYVFIMIQCKQVRTVPSLLATSAVDLYLNEPDPQILTQFIYDNRGKLPPKRNIRFDLMIEEPTFEKLKKFVDDINTPDNVKEFGKEITIPKAVVQAICQTFNYKNPSPSQEM